MAQVKVRKAKITELVQDDRNLNKGTARGKELIQKSIGRFGAVRGVAVDKDNRIIAGNKTVENAIEQGVEEIIIVETTGKELVVTKRVDTSLDSKEGREMALADNATVKADLAWDLDAMNEVASDFEIDTDSWLSEFPQDENLPEELQGPQTEVKEDDFDPDAHYETKVKAGEVWQLGEHRLMCGDSTDADAVAKLMNGERADIAFTSPPYGVNDGSIRKHQEKGKSDHEAKNFYLEHDDNQSTWPQLVEETWQRMHENTDQQFINIQMLADNKRELVKWCARHADNLCDILIWDKGHAAPQMQPNIVSNNYENIYVFGDDKCSRTLKYGNFHGTFGAIIRVGVGQNEYADIHKAVFPVALPAEILNINGNAKSVLDLFGGTGTTMIAAEQLGRKCFMMELDPHYCTVIIARWEKLTGQKAIKLNP